MVKLSLPIGTDYSVEEFKLPDLQSAIHLFGAHWRKVGAKWTYPEHDHPLFEINLVVEGEQVMTVNGKELQQKAGELLIIRPGETHASQTLNESMSYFCLHFDIDDTLFRRLLCRSNVVHYTSDSIVAERIRPALDKLMDISKRKNPFRITDRMQTLSAAFDLCAGLGESLSNNEDKSFGTLQAHWIQTAGRIAELIEQAADYPNGKVSISGDHQGIHSMIKELGYSPSYCNRIFHRVYGMSPRQYLSTIKLRKAKLLLMDHERSIEEIAEILGYKDIAHFSRQFKRWTNSSPSFYRQNIGVY
jgi:AraC family transcriptional activator of pobA